MDYYLAFLKQALPDDWACYPESLFREFATHACMLRQSVPWCADLEEELFLHYVLCPRVNDEGLSSHRPLFYSLLWGRVRDLEMEQAVLEVNRWCHEHATYQAQDIRTASPYTVYRSGFGRCGEESAFLAAALRSVGLPARQVYAPQWSHCDDNHAWVEAWAGGRWHFLGACEPEPVLDRGWFQTAASRAMLVHSRTFGPVSRPSLHGTALDRSGQALLHNQTARYARTKQYLFRVLLHSAPVPGAQVRLSILNEACFHPIACLTTGKDGTALVELGIGDVHVSAAWNGFWAEAICQGGQVAGLTLSLSSPQEPASDWTYFSFLAPKGASSPPEGLSEAQKQSRAAVLAHGDALRAGYVASFYDVSRSLPEGQDFLYDARGNFDEIAAFLSADSNPLRLALLGALSKKDLRDATARLLEHHLKRAAPFAGQFPDPVYTSGLLSPRVAFERLTDWSQPGDGPVGAVIRLRLQGVPARLRLLDGAPEAWRGSWQPLVPEPMGQVAFLHTGEQPPSYRQSWSLARWRESGWQNLNLEDSGWSNGKYGIALPAGRYRILSCLRLPSGDQRAASLDFTLQAGTQRDIPLQQPTCQTDDLLFDRALPPLEGAPEPGSCALLLWLEEGAEPTEHVLNELLTALPVLRCLPVSLTIFLRSRSALAQPTLASLLAQWPEIHTVCSGWSYQLELLCRYFGCDPDRPPLAVICNPAGRAVFAAGGYQVGLVRVLTDLVTYLNAPCG